MVSKMPINVSLEMKMISTVYIDRSEIMCFLFSRLQEKKFRNFIRHVPEQAAPSSMSTQATGNSSLISTVTDIAKDFEAQGE